MVWIFILIYFEWCDTENQQSVAESKFGHQYITVS